jgi:FkbM family methyltransferase
VENNPYKLNTWLDPLIQNYIEYFGRTERPVVWEVGSRDGRDGAEIATRIYDGSPDWFWSRARVVALEPNPDQVKVIEKNYPEIEVMKVAASNQKGEAPFIVYGGDEGAVGSSSLNLRWKEDDLEGHIITVPIDRLENLIGDEKIDIMKIDCEGHSMEVIEGLGDKLKQVKVYHIETEKWTDSNIKVRAYMMSHGYLLVDDTEQYGGMPDQVWVRH